MLQEGKFPDYISEVQTATTDLLSNLPTPTRSGYQFSGWYLDEACSEYYRYEKLSKKALTLYAGGLHQATGFNLIENDTAYEIKLYGNVFNEFVIQREFLGLPVTRIANEGFAGLDKLDQITIPDSITSIGAGAFAGCNKLTSIHIPASVSSIESNALTFFGCTKLTEILIDENNSYYKSVDGVLYNKNQTIILCYPIGNTEASFTIPGTVIEIGNYAFYRSNLTEVELPSTLEVIGEYAFYNCKLNSLTLPSTVKTIKKASFYNCIDLTSVIIPETVTIMGEDVFGSCDDLTIYCEVEEQPSGWHIEWNKDNRPVVWGCTA